MDIPTALWGYIAGMKFKRAFTHVLKRSQAVNDADVAKPLRMPVLTTEWFFPLSASAFHAQSD